jgi:hypothetical protein
MKMIARNSQTNDPVRNAVGNVSLSIEGRLVWSEIIFFNSKGIVSFPVPSNGQYNVSLIADGFITTHVEVVVDCIADCIITEYVIMSPHLEIGQTRIILNWQQSHPQDIDLHVMAINKTDNNMCRIWYDNKFGCQSASQDRDNAAGGPNGAETVTLLDNIINSQFTYLIAIEDYDFMNNGEDFLNSGAAIAVKNELKSFEQMLKATTIVKETDYYFFGCVIVQETTTINVDFDFTAAPNGTFFDGEDDSKWLAMMITHC